MSQEQLTPPQIPKITLGTSSVYPKKLQDGFEMAARTGYDGVEVMVLGDPATQNPDTLTSLADKYNTPILSIHAPTLLVSQRVWGTNDPWEKIDRSIDLAHAVGTNTVVLHPPFRWQREYAREFAEGVAAREASTGAILAVENMFPWRAGSVWMQVYRPGWNPVDFDYAHVTLDFSHAAIAHDDVMAMKKQLGTRLHHIHLGDGTGSFMDEHLVPGRGNMPIADFLADLGQTGWDGVIATEVSTRKANDAQREKDLRETVEFARTHLRRGAQRNGLQD
ncbi:sugar phosphate isomerase/epimerase [Dermatophilus congolensis]|uniref:sugar phosphate isomerase/epimerase family protein n=1 Tax=Dermatophilus congolensis TaxID=1863 RepID=UPI00312CC290